MGTTLLARLPEREDLRRLPSAALVVQSLDEHEEEDEATPKKKHLFSLWFN